MNDSTMMKAVLLCAVLGIFAAAQGEDDGKGDTAAQARMPAIGKAGADAIAPATTGAEDLAFVRTRQARADG